MAISFRCQCGQKLAVREEFAGRSVRCPACATVMKAPAPIAEPPAEVADEYALADEPKPAPGQAPAGFGAAGARGEPSKARAAASRTSLAPARSESPHTDEEAKSSFREYLYLGLVLALIPLVFSVLAPKATNFEERLKAALDHASPETQNRIKSLESQEGVGLDDLIKALPQGKLDASAHLPRATWVHWAYAAITAAAFWLLTLAMFPGERRTPHHLLLVGLFTGTIGIILLLGFQMAASATQGVWLRGRGIILILFYIVKFIGWSYASASDPESNLFLSFVGFTCGVGLCEELCKALPLIGYYRRDDQMGWRGAAVWGLASGAGFGVAEGIMYCARYYNGIAPLDSYVVRFVSCVALHAIWTAAVGITMWRRQETIQGDLDWTSFSLSVLQILAVPMILHGLYDTLLKKDLEVWALAVGAASFAWLVFQVERARGTDAEEKPAHRRAWT
jgi:RsiW-degrading membrane proteinase PrsW (M82 family)